MTPIDGNQPLPGAGDPSTWLPVQQRRPLYPVQPADHQHQHDSVARARSDYNALQTTFKQRLWNGLDFVANYTLSKAISNNLGLLRVGRRGAEGAYPVNSYDIEANYGPAFFDARHIFSMAGSYDLPFGRDRHYGSRLEPRARRAGRRLGRQLRRHGAHRVPDHGAGRLRTRRCRPRGRRRAARPHRRPDAGRPDLERWIDRAAFQSAPLGSSAIPASASLRAPGYWNVDFSLSKRFVTFGSQYFMFRGEIVQPAQPPELRAAGAQHPEPDVRHDHQHRRRPARRAAGAEVLLLGLGEARQTGVPYASLHGYSS